MAEREIIGRDAVMTHTQNWLSRVVIEHKLCPFAKAEFDAGRIHYAVITAADLQSQLEHVLAACDALSADESLETSLLIFPSALLDFGDYLDVLALSEQLLEDQGYGGIFQLASFHPHYIFEGPAPDDASHYTNRSPYPVLHILREASVAAALARYPKPETIPARNIALMRRLGARAMQDLLASCLRD